MEQMLECQRSACVQTCRISQLAHALNIVRLLYSDGPGLHRTAKVLVETHKEEKNILKLLTADDANSEERVDES